MHTTDIRTLQPLHLSIRAPRRLGIALAALGLVVSAENCFPGRTRSEDTKAPSGTIPADVPANAPLRFPIPTRWPPFTAKIVEIGADGAARLRPPDRDPPATPAARPEITEGYYLGVVKEGLGPSLRGARLVRVQVTDVGDKDTWQIRVAESAAPALHTGEIVFLIRPTGATTARLKQLPDLAALEEGPSPGERKEQDERTKLAQSCRNLRKIGRAMHHFMDAHGHFPPAVIIGPNNKPWHSWRVLLLPFLDSTELHRQYKYDEPWDGPNNRKLLDKMPGVYSDPIHGPNDEFYTHYAAVTGDSMAFTADGVEFHGDDIVRALGEGRGIAQFRDGVSNTLLVGSVGPDRKIPWMKPEDVVVDAKLPKLGKKGGFATPYRTEAGNAAPFLWADGFARALLDTIDDETFHALLTLDGGERDERFVKFPNITLPPLEGDLAPVIYILHDGKKVVARLAQEALEVAPDPDPPADEPDSDKDELPNDPFGVRRGQRVPVPRPAPRGAPR